MYALIYNQHGEEQFRLLLEDHALLDCDHYANIFSGLYGLEIKGLESGSEIPDGCEDFRVVLQDTPGAVTCWNSKNYMLEA
jgi:hypothetical protein